MKKARKVIAAALVGFMAMGYIFFGLDKLGKKKTQKV